METLSHKYYVSLEVSKLLKEAGFDWEIDTFYQRYYEGDGNDNSIPTEEFVLHNTDYAHCSNWNNTSLTHINGILHRLSAPTLDVAQRWLREVKNIQIIASPLSGSKKWTPLIAKDFWLLHEDISGIALTSENFDTYELALESGIKKALEIILEKGEQEL